MTTVIDKNVKDMMELLERYSPQYTLYNDKVKAYLADGMVESIYEVLDDSIKEDIKHYEED